MVRDRPAGPYPELTVARRHGSVSVLIQGQPLDRDPESEVPAGLPTFFNDKGIT